MAPRAPAPHIPKPWRIATWTVLAAGLLAALVLYVVASSQEDGPLGDPSGSKLYLHQLEVYGGRANILQDEFRRWFEGLWHGRNLAGTVAVLTLAAAWTVRFLGRLAGLPPLPPPAPQAPPRPRIVPPPDDRGD